MRILIFGILAGLLAACADVPPADIDYTYDNLTTIQTVDEAALTYRLDHPDGHKSVPLVVVIDGSTCRGLKTNGMLSTLRPDSTAPKPYARLIVEKIGVGDDDDGSACSDVFLQNYSIEDRIIQHLRALQHVRTTSDWWNGELLIWGWSDGGDIGAQLMAYYPNTKRAVLGAMGGGLTMAEGFKVEFCPKDKIKTTDKYEACLAKLEKRYEQIRRNPTWDETWLGGDNTLKVWETRLFSRLSHLLIDNNVPMLIVHGTEDHGQIKGARKLRDKLTAAGNTAFTYWEIDGMAHSPRNLTTAQNTKLYNLMRDFLLTGERTKPDLTVSE